MRKFAIVAASAISLAAVPTLLSAGAAQAGGKDAAAFLGGVLLGGAIANATRPPVYVAPAPVYVAPPPVYVPAPVYGGYAQAHYNWCAGRYASYDPGSNTFQPYGPYPRRQCISPYM